MFIVFNLGGFVVGVVIALFTFGIDYFLPTIFDATYGELGFAFLMLAVAILIEISGLAPRIFFIPCWILGVLAVGLVCAKLWGWWALIGIIAALIGVVFLLMKLSGKKERRHWDTIRKEFPGYQQYKNSMEDDEKKEKLLNFFYNNNFVDNSTEIHQHNHSVLSEIMSSFSELFSEEETVGILAFGQKIQGMIESNKPEWEEDEDEYITKVNELLEAKLS